MAQSKVESEVESGSTTNTFDGGSRISLFVISQWGLGERSDRIIVYILRSSVRDAFTLSRVGVDKGNLNR